MITAFFICYGATLQTWQTLLKYKLQICSQYKFVIIIANYFNIIKQICNIIVSADGGTSTVKENVVSNPTATSKVRNEDKNPLDKYKDIVIST